MDQALASKPSMNTRFFITSSFFLNFPLDAVNLSLTPVNSFVSNAMNADCSMLCRFLVLNSLGGYLAVYLEVSCRELDVSAIPIYSPIFLRIQGKVSFDGSVRLDSLVDDDICEVRIRSNSCWTSDVTEREAAC